MSGAIATTAIIGGSLAAAGSVAGAAISSHAAGKAADAQATAADNAAQLQYRASQDALAFQKQQYATSQAQMQPWLQSGQGALSNLNYLLGLGGQPQAQAAPQPGSQPALGINGARAVGPEPAGGMRMALPANAGQTAQGLRGGWSPLDATANPVSTGMNGVNIPASGNPPPGATTQPPPVNTALGGFGSLMQPYGQQFTAPTDLTEQNDPGYQARLALGTDAIQRSAAARGGVLTGGTAKALDQYAQDYASNEYGNVYSRAFNQYAQGYNQYEQNQTNQYNRLAALAGVGQQTAQQLGMLGNQTAQGVSNNLLSTAQGMGQSYQNAAAANASGYYNQAAAINGGISGGLGALSQYQMLKQLQGINSSPAVYGGGSLYGV